MFFCEGCMYISHKYLSVFQQLTWQEFNVHFRKQFYVFKFKLTSLEFAWLKPTSKLDINNQFEINNHIFVMFSMLVENQWEIYNILDRFYLDFGKHWLIANYHTLCEWLPSGHKYITKWPPQIFCSSHLLTGLRCKGCVYLLKLKIDAGHFGTSLWREKGKICGHFQIKFFTFWASEIQMKSVMMMPMKLQRIGKFLFSHFSSKNFHNFSVTFPHIF